MRGSMVPRGSAALASAVAVTVLAAGCTGAGGAGSRATEGSAGPSPTPSSSSAPPAKHSTPANAAGRIDLHADPATILARAGHGGVPVLAYHQVRNRRSDDSKRARQFIMPVAKFKSQMGYLDSHGYHTISPDQLLAHLTTGASLPTKPVMLSFDDGEKGQFSTAFPTLEKHHFTATFFPMTVVLGKKHWMSPQNLRTMDKAGMTIGDHTYDHHRVDHYSGHDWEKQLAGSKQKLEGILGHPVRYFAYPNGIWSTAAFSHLKADGFWAAFQVSFDPIDKKAPRYTLLRTHVNPQWSTAEFAEHVKE
jgi:peptidoglycan/xylan/chitin deacetylase (PgdA/CDA1 family)